MNMYHRHDAVVAGIRNIILDKKQNIHYVTSVQHPHAPQQNSPQKNEYKMNAETMSTTYNEYVLKFFLLKKC